MTDNRRFVGSVYLLMFVYGTQVTVIGIALPGMIKEFSITNGAGGFLVTLQSMGGIGALAATLAVADLLPRVGVTFGAFAFLALCNLAVWFSPSYLAVASMFVLFGGGMRAFDAMANTSVGEFGGALRNRSMNLLHAFFAAGALSGPLIAQAVENVFDTWRAIFLVNGLVAASVIAPVLVVGRNGAGRSFAPPAPARPKDRREHGVLRRSGFAYLLFTGLALAFYAAHQTTMTAWLPLLIETTGALPGSASGVVLSAYWVGIITGRLVASRIPDRVDRLVLIGSGAVVAAVATSIGIAVATRSAPAAFFFFLAGATSGALIPLAMTEGQSALPGRTGMVTAAFSLFLLAGGIAGPWTVGGLADTFGIRAALFAAAAILVPCLPAVLAAGVSRQRFAERPDRTPR